MSSVSELPVIQDPMQSCLVSVSYLSDRTQCSHAWCQCSTCHTGHNAVMPSVSVVICQTGHNAVMPGVSAVPVRQDTMQSSLVSVQYLSDRTQCSHV